MLGDLRDAEGLAQLFDFRGFEFFGSLLPALIDAALLRKGDAGGLAFLIVLKLNLPKTEKHRNHHLSDNAANVDLLGDGYETNVLFQPSSDSVHAFQHTPGDAVELPHQEGFNLAGENRLLQLLEGQAVEVLAGFLILEPAYSLGVDAVVSEPPGDLLALGFGFLVVG